MNNYKQQVNNRNSGILDTVCYLYTENDRLKMMTSGTYGDMPRLYGAVNAAVNISDNNVDVATLKIANPNFIFYADKATLDKIKGDTTLASLGAVKTGKILRFRLKKCQDPAILLWKHLKNGLLYVSRPKAKVCNRHNKGSGCDSVKD